MSYHVRTLAELGVIRPERATPRRGAVEHHYRATVRAQREIAARLWGSTSGTVGRMLAAAHPPRYRRRSQGSKLDPFELVIREVLVEWPQIKSQKYGHLAGGQDPAPE
jgi:hypothetical protein